VTVGVEVRELVGDGVLVGELVGVGVETPQMLELKLIVTVRGLHPRFEVRVKMTGSEDRALVIEAK
jgi:hypothetical protein